MERETNSYDPDLGKDQERMSFGEDIKDDDEEVTPPPDNGSDDEKTEPPSEKEQEIIVGLLERIQKVAERKKYGAIGFWGFKISISEAQQTTTADITIIFGKNEMIIPAPDELLSIIEKACSELDIKPKFDKENESERKLNIATRIPPKKGSRFFDEDGNSRQNF